MLDEIDTALNPHRAEEQARAREHDRDVLRAATAQLRHGSGDAGGPPS